MKYNDEESYYEKMKQTSTPAPTQGEISDKGRADLLALTMSEFLI